MPEHTTRLIPRNQGPVRKFEPFCDYCRWRGTPTTDRETAKNIAKMHGTLEVGA
jgi:hypothetical protein